MLYHKKYLKYKNKYINLKKYQNKYEYLDNKPPNHLNLENGIIRYTYPNGDMYEGQYINNHDGTFTKYGHGLYIFVESREVYNGYFINNMFNGLGTLRNVDGDVYTGNFANNMFNGEGTLKYANGDVYVGNFVDDQLYGRGRMNYPNEEYMEGIFKYDEITEPYKRKFKIIDEKYNGKIYKNGIYEGMMKNDSFNGLGRITFLNENGVECIFEGNFINDILDNGYANLTFANENKYEGQIIKDNYNGRGILNFKDGSRYEGTFENGKYNGHGKITSPNGNYKEGIFENGKIIGKYIQKYIQDEHTIYEGESENGEFDGSGILIDNTRRYEGNFKNGTFNGLGTVIYKDGNRYEGNFENGKYNGHGKITSPNGNYKEGIFENGKIIGKYIQKYIQDEHTIYEGESENGEFDGSGILIDNTRRYEGNFKNGTFNGLGTVIYKDGNRYEGNFENGKFNGPGVYTYKNGIQLRSIFTNSNANIDIVYNRHFNQNLPKYQIVIYVLAHGCDIKDKSIKEELSKYNRIINPIYLKATRHQCLIEGKSNNLNISLANLIFNTIPDTGTAIKTYQEYVRGENKISHANYEHIFQFGLEEGKFNNLYDGIFITKNDIGLPNNINLFDWNNEPTHINTDPELRGLGNILLKNVQNNKYLLLSHLIIAFIKWIHNQKTNRIIANPFLDLIIIDNSCRGLCSFF